MCKNLSEHLTVDKGTPQGLDEDIIIIINDIFSSILGYMQLY